MQHQSMGKIKLNHNCKYSCIESTLSAAQSNVWCHSFYFHHMPYPLPSSRAPVSSNHTLCQPSVPAIFKWLQLRPPPLQPCSEHSTILEHILFSSFVQPCVWTLSESITTLWTRPWAFTPFLPAAALWQWHNNYVMNGQQMGRKHANRNTSSNTNTIVDTNTDAETIIVIWNKRWKDMQPNICNCFFFQLKSFDELRGF